MSKKGAGVIAAIALLGGLLFLLLGRSQRQDEPPSRVAVEDQPASRPAAGRALPPQRLVTASGPVVEAITVERPEVCSGEENLVTVTLAGDHQKDENLRITMPGLGTAGAQMPFRLWLAAGKQQPEMPEVVVLGRDGALATIKVPTVTVKDCIPGPSLSVEVALAANTSTTFALTATVSDPGSTPFNPVRWHWDFGDGADATTKVRTVEHRYEDRPQKSRTSSFLVHVRAANADGVELLGRYSLDLRNEASEVLRQKNAVVIGAELTPRSPEIGADGRVTQRVRIHHAHDQPVIVDRVVVQRFRDNAQGVEEMHATDVDPRQILGTNVIPPGRGVETTAVLDTRAEPKTRRVIYELHAKSADGIRASGQFSVQRPGDPTPREEREVVTDPRLNAELAAARAKLGREQVSLDELLRLRREGAFNNLPASDAQQTPAGDQR